MQLLFKSKLETNQTQYYFSTCKKTVKSCSESRQNFVNAYFICILSVQACTVILCTSGIINFI